MGVIKHFQDDMSYSNNDNSCCGGDCGCNKQTNPLVIPDGNPDPKNYKIQNSIEENGNLALFVLYPDSTNYEGLKILVYENCTLKELKNQGLIDPHFSHNTSFKYPVARFEPTARGWRWAQKFITVI